MFGTITDKHSILNVNDPANYKPIQGDWRVRVKYGRGWRILLNERASSDRSAAQRVHKDTGYRTIQIKMADMPDKWRTFRFKKSKNEIIHVCEPHKGDSI